MAHVAPHQEVAVLIHVVAEWQLRNIATVERKNKATQKTADNDATVTFVRREVVGLALRVVEFLLLCLHIYVGVGQLTEVDLRTRHAQRAHRTLDRHIA